MTSEHPGAIVTGAGSGIGRAAAIRLAQDGWCVGCLDIDAAALDCTVGQVRNDGLRAEPIACDVGDRGAVFAAVACFGDAHGIGALVNNAVWISFGPIEEIDEDAIDRMLAVGIKGALFCIQSSLPYLVKSATEIGDAAIVNLASGAVFRGTPEFSVYSAVKGALASLTRQNAVELGPRGIRSNAVAPGPIPTEGALDATPDVEGWKASAAARTPLGRMGTAEEVAQVIAFLCGKESRWVNGQVISTDGGRGVTA